MNTNLTRPPGHITEQIQKLTKWRNNRENKNLPTKDLDVTICYLEDYRDLINAVRKG